MLCESLREDEKCTQDIKKGQHMLEVDLTNIVYCFESQDAGLQCSSTANMDVWELVTLWEQGAGSPQEENTETEMGN